MDSFLAAAVQMTSGADKARNVERAQALVRAAAAAGARFVGLPENFAWMGPEADRAGAAEGLTGPTLASLAGLARELSITLLAGSLLEAGAPEGRLYNTSVLLGPDGSRLGTYRKIHLFDVEVGDGQTYRESAAVAPGSEVVVAQAPFGKVGLSVCYDVRFPELYRRCSAQGATVLTVPAAFTLMTGKDHWEVLLRARAIENLCHVLAPAQWGTHPRDRRTYGNAMLVDPWGLVIARASDGEGFALGPIDGALTARLRKGLPALEHRRL
jgi:predicted amidohydrolase